MKWATVRVDSVAPEVRESIDPSIFGEDEVHHWSIPALDATGVPSVEPASSIGSTKIRLTGEEILVSRLNPRKARVVRTPAALDGLHVCSGEFVVLRPTAVEPRFLEYALRSEKTRQQFDANVQSVTRSHQRMRPEQVRQLQLKVPTRPRQRAIADFLDAEVARIDALVRKKQQLAESLETHLYTKIEAEILKLARGAVPLRRLLQQPGQYGASESGEAGEEDWPRYIRITDLAPDGSLRLDNAKRLAPVIARPFMLAHGDLLFARSGATTGKAFRYQLSMGPAAFAGYLIRFRFDSARILPELVDLWTRTRHYGDQIGESTVQATIQNVSADRYASLMVPIVPVEQQPRLVDELVGARRLHSEACGGLAQQIDLLQERRQALITAAVTGDLDVAEAG